MEVATEYGEELCGVLQSIDADEVSVVRSAVVRLVQA